jgi:hypothetical protein
LDVTGEKSWGLQSFFRDVALYNSCALDIVQRTPLSELSDQARNMCHHPVGSAELIQSQNRRYPYSSLLGNSQQHERSDHAGFLEIRSVEYNSSQFAEIPKSHQFLFRSLIIGQKNTRFYPTSSDKVVSAFKKY